MATKRVSRNQDLILDYNTINLLANPVSVNNAVLEARLPRIFQMLSTDQAMAPGGTISWNGATTLKDTFTTVTPSYPDPGDAAGNFINFTFPCYVTITGTGSITNQADGGEDYAFWLVHRVTIGGADFTESACYAKCNALQDPPLVNFSCSWSGYVTPADFFSVKVRASQNRTWNCRLSYIVH